MFKYYVKLDEQGYPVADGQPAITSAEGMTEFVAYTATDKEYFLRYYSHYRQDSNGNWVAPDNLPSLQVSSLLRSIQDQGQTIADQKGTITDLQTDLADVQSDANTAKQDAKTANDALTAANTTITQLQTMAGSLTGQVAQANQTITTLQGLVGTLTGQIAQMKVAQTTTATTE